MCGITGFTGRPDKPTLEKMVHTLTHRGPDDFGLWEDEQISLGMRRLSIVDLETGQQPVFNEDGTIAVVFNGEIYNHVELRKQLEHKHRFASDHSDTEVIVHLYEEYGRDFLNRLNGMFAIALWDGNSRELLLARDHVGIKPLYYSVLPRGVVFGSEPKAILAHPDVPRDPDFVAIHHYFSLKNIPSPSSAYDAVKQLGPGEYAVFANGKRESVRWWKPSFKENGDITEQEAAEQIRELLEDSVRLQMRSDVPIGAYLSGGVDSSSVVALMSRFGNNPVRSFTLIYEDGFKSKDTDRECALEVSRMYGTEHHEHFVSYRDIPAHIDRIVGSFDEPYSGVISTYFVTQLIGEHVKVALSGDGADELFGSYLAHRLATPLSLLDQFGAGLKSQDHPELMPFENQMDWLTGIASRGDEAARRMGLYISNDETNIGIYSNAMKAHIGNATTEALVRAGLTDSRTKDPLNRILYLDMNTLLADQVLPFVDRLSMAHSVEVRPPFLDPRLIQFAASLPGSMKIKGGRVKHILKEAVRPLLPQSILDRPKEGFIMPINEWILGNLRDFVMETLGAARLQRHGLFRKEAVNQMIEEHYSGKVHHGNRLWNLIMFQLWWDRYIQ